MQVGVLGPIELIDESGRARSIGSPNQRTVLAVLASRRGRVVSADTLIEAVWGDDIPPSALQSLRTYVSRLRRVVGDALVSHPGGYGLEVDCDAEVFERMVADASQSDTGGEVEALRAALALWRGPAYMGLEDIPGLAGEIHRLHEIRQAAIESLAAHLLDQGQAAAAIVEAEELLAEAPLREGTWTILTRALSAEGRTADALRAVNRAVAELAEAGLEPSQALRDAESEALAGAPPAQSQTAPRPTGLVGRDDDVAAISDLLETARLVTLVGPGGVGKSSLAAVVAEHRSAAHRLGIRTVELAALHNPQNVPGAIIDGMGLTRGADLDDALGAAGRLDALLVLDNCEHLLDGVATALERMLDGGPNLRVLASSRERLGVAGEHAWTVSPLGLAGDDPPARQLFIERARATAPEVDLSAENFPTIDRIVRRIDGLPLAIEMAASGLATVSLDELAELLEERLDLLRSNRRSADARHRTLRAVIEWSEALLAPQERDAWGAMSVFASPARRDDIAAVIDEATALDLAPRLAERSLLVVDRTRSATRYAMLETVRPQATAQLGDRAAALTERHARHFAQRLEQLNSDLLGPAEPECVSAIDDILPDIRQSIRWAIDHDLRLAAGIVASLYRYAHHCLLDQPLAWAERLLPRLDGSEPSYAAVLTAAADRSVHAGDLAAAEGLVRSAVAADPHNHDALELLADITSYEGRLDESIEVSKRMFETAVGSGDLAGEALARTNLAISLAYRGDSDAGSYLVDLDGVGPSLQGWCAYSRGEVLLDTDPDQAILYLEDAVALADSVRNRFLGGVSRVSLASLRAWTGDPDAAIDTFIAIVDHWRSQGARTHLLPTLRHLVILLSRLGAYTTAAELFGNVAPDDTRPSWGSEADRLGQVADTLTNELGSARLGELMAVGAARSIDDATDAALAELMSLAASRV